MLSGGELISVDGLNAILFVYLFPLICLIIAYVFFIQVYRETDNQAVKRKIRLVLIGITLIMSGVVYFALRDILISAKELAAVSGYVGHAFYLSGDVFIFVGFK
ncbi:MAG: hypothetical protein ACFFD4_19290 [Candidatus Odinarchaeota archaeon]